jgi:hypothetical protein
VVTNGVGCVKTGEWIIVEVEMQEIELGRTLIDPLQHHHVQRVGIAHGTIEPQSARPTGIEPRARHRVAAGKQRDFVAERNQLLGQPRHHALSPAIQLRRHRFRQRGDLRNMHRIGPFLWNTPSPRVPRTRQRTAI